jgi:hypothetical protein
MTSLTRAQETVGAALGALLAPITAAISRVRHARMFHPDGLTYRGRVTAAPGTPWPAVAARLTGPVLTRWSSAWWRGDKEWPDVLGLAVRFRHDEAVSTEPADGDQDLLLATIRRPWTTPLAPLTTRVHDFLSNDYYAVSPFDIAGLGRAQLRVVSVQTAPEAASRRARLARAVETGAAHWRIEVRPDGTHQWQPLVELRLTSPVQLDQQRLRFSPFQDGRGLNPRGLVHALRLATYRASQVARRAAPAAATAAS